MKSIIVKLSKALIISSSAMIISCAHTQSSNYEKAVKEQFINEIESEIEMILWSWPIYRPAWFRRATEKSGCIHDGNIYDHNNCWSTI